MKLSPEPSINGVHQRYGRWVDDTSDLVDRTDAAHRLAWNFCAGFTGAVGLFRTAHWSTLAAGTRVWRVHSTRRSTLAPNPTAQPDELSGDRFDSLDGVFAYLYIADSPGGAIAETICRDLPLDPTVARIVPASAVTGRTLTALRVTRTLTVAALHGPRLSAVGQDLWLTKCEARHYVTTRRWVAAIYATDPALGGLAYRPRHNEDTLEWVLTTGPVITSHPALAVDSSVTALSLDRGRGRDLVERIVADHSAILSVV